MSDAMDEVHYDARVDDLIEQIDSINAVEKLQRENPELLRIIQYSMGQLTFREDLAIEERLQSDAAFFDLAYLSMRIALASQPKSWRFTLDKTRKISRLSLRYTTGMIRDESELTDEERDYDHIARRWRRERKMRQLLAASPRHRRDTEAAICERLFLSAHVAFVGVLQEARRT